MKITKQKAQKPIEKEEPVNGPIYKLNLKKSPVDTRDYVAETIFSQEAADLPEEYDTRPDLLPVRDQKQQGACAGFASAVMKEWQEKHDIGFSDYMSPQFIYNNRENKDSDGMYSRDVMKILNKIGSVSEANYPYETTKKITKDLLEEAANHKIKGYAQVHTIEGLKKALIVNGPCYFAVPVYNFGPRMWMPQKQGDELVGGHAMAVISYTKEGFVIRNSWSRFWGDSGYTIFPYSDWGMHWEAWTTIDDESGKPIVIKKKSLWDRLTYWIPTWDRIKMFIKNLF